MVKKFLICCCLPLKVLIRTYKYNGTKVDEIISSKKPNKNSSIQRLEDSDTEQLFHLKLFKMKDVTQILVAVLGDSDSSGSRISGNISIAEAKSKKVFCTSSIPPALEGAIMVCRFICID